MNVSTFRRSALAAAVTLATCGLSQASFAIAFDQNVTPNVIFGSGVTNGSFTTDTAGGVELGLRGKLRHNAVGAPENTFNSNGDGTYSFAAGNAFGQPAGTAVWSFEWAINSDVSGTSGLTIDAFTYALGLDTDPSLGTSFLSFDPIFAVNPNFGEVRWDHSLGTNATAQSGGVESGVASEAAYAAGIAANNVAQNSWKPSWYMPGFDPTVDGTYDFYLAAFNANGAEVARTAIQIIVGAGGDQPVPEPATLALVGAGLLGFARSRRKAR